MEKCFIFDIIRSSLVDGDGIRTTVFFMGCDLRCKWCHNPESQTAKKKLLFYKDKCVGCGSCKEKCRNGLTDCVFCGECEIYCQGGARKVCGKEIDTDMLLNKLLTDKPFYDASGGGVTFSGGECMLQKDALTEILKKCKDSGISTAVDTAGHVPYSYFEQVMPYTDIFLYDVKCIDEQLHLEGTGVKNDRILENLERLSREYSGKITARVPVIGGFNDTITEMASIASFLRRLGINDVQLMPYHKMGENKYSALGMERAEFYTPDEADMARFRALF